MSKWVKRTSKSGFSRKSKRVNFTRWKWVKVKFTRFTLSSYILWEVKQIYDFLLKSLWKSKKKIACGAKYYKTNITLAKFSKQQPKKQCWESVRMTVCAVRIRNPYGYGIFQISYPYPYIRVSVWKKTKFSCIRLYP